MPTVLVVDDQEAFRQFIALALSFEGFQVTAVGDGEAALAQVRRAVPDLVVLDLSMPQVSGWQVLRVLRSDPLLSQVPVIVVTANADQETRERCAHARVQALLVKPVSLDEILATIHHVLDRPA